MLNDMCPTKPTNTEESVEDGPKRYRKLAYCTCCSSERAFALRAGYPSLQKHTSNFDQKRIKKKLHFPSKDTVTRQPSSRTHYQRAARDKLLSWSKYVCGLENVSICTYCQKILPGDDLPILRRHALADRHKLRRKLQERTSQVFSHTKKSVLVPSIGLNHFNGSLKDQLLTRKKVLKVKKERQQETSQKISKVAGVSQEILSSAMNCFVPLSPLHFQEFPPVNEWKHDQPGKPSSFKPWSQTVGPKTVVFDHVKESPSRSPRHTAFNLKEVNTPFAEPSKESFMSSLGLLPKEAAMKMTKVKGSRECESIDVDEETPHAESESLTPTCTTSDPSKDEREPSLQSTRKTGHGMNLRKLFNKTDVKLNLACTNKSLYNIDLTSPLGFLVRRHLRRDAFLNIRSDFERYCVTKVSAEELSAVSLRQRRLMFRTTFQDSSVLKHCHQYKFNREQKKEFMKYVETGLNKQGRALLKLLKPCFVGVTRLRKKEINKWIQPRCSVVLKRLTASEILYWSQPKTRDIPAAHDSHGFELTLPCVADVVSLQTKRQVCGGVSRPSILGPKEASTAPSNRGLQASMPQTEVENVPMTGLLPGCVLPSPWKRTLPVSIPGSGVPQPIVYLPDITNLNQENTCVGVKSKSNTFSKTDHWLKIQTDRLNVDTLIGSAKMSKSFTSLPCVDTKNVGNYKRSVIKLGHTPGDTCTIPGQAPEPTVRRSRRSAPGHNPDLTPGYSTGHSPEHTVGHTQSHMAGTSLGQTGFLPRRSLRKVTVRHATEGALILPVSNESKPLPSHRYPTVTRFLGSLKMLFRNNNI